MKKILIGFIAIGLITLVGCEKDDDTDTETTDTSSGEAKDADGNIYTSVTIGTQEWMSENLRTTKYSDGTSIPNVTGFSQWDSLNSGAWCYYNNDNQYDTIYGKLYNYYAVNTNKLCPTGWHVPTDADWTELTDYLTADGHSSDEGTALKATSGWVDGGYEINGTDDYGWKGLPGGYRFTARHAIHVSSFSSIGSFGYWWSSSESCRYLSWDRFLGHIPFLGSNANENSGKSVRCLRD